MLHRSSTLAAAVRNILYGIIIQLVPWRLGAARVSPPPGRGPYILFLAARALRLHPVRRGGIRYWHAVSVYLCSVDGARARLPQCLVARSRGPGGFWKKNKIKKNTHVIILSSSRKSVKSSYRRKSRCRVRRRQNTPIEYSDRPQKMSTDVF